MLLPLNAHPYSSCCTIYDIAALLVEEERISSKTKEFPVRQKNFQ
jgi:hypothetical protein